MPPGPQRVPPLVVGEVVEPHAGRRSRASRASWSPACGRRVAAPAVGAERVGQRRGERAGATRPPARSRRRAGPRIIETAWYRCVEETCTEVGSPITPVAHHRQPGRVRRASAGTARRPGRGRCRRRRPTAPADPPGPARAASRRARGRRPDHLPRGLGRHRPRHRHGMTKSGRSRRAAAPPTCANVGTPQPAVDLAPRAPGRADHAGHPERVGRRRARRRKNSQRQPLPMMPNRVWATEVIWAPHVEVRMLTVSGPPPSLRWC